MVTLRSPPPWEQQDNALTADDLSGTSTAEVSTDFEFLNDSFARARMAPASFHQFQQLPLELREYIWEFSLPQQRLLKVTVTGDNLANDYTLFSRGDESKNPYHPQYQRANELGNIVSDASYHLRLRSTSINSPVIYVSREANKVAHRIYRVRMPALHGRCQTVGTKLSQERTPRSTNSNPPLLRFCPERDTILINVERGEDTPHFAHFVHDALAYDPEKKGILHMAIESSDTNPLPIYRDYMSPTIEPSNRHAPAQAALRSTLVGLESLSFIHLFRAESRQMFSSLQAHFLANRTPQTEAVRFNRAYPLWSSTASYSTLLLDPRPIFRYLSLVDCGRDPLSLVCAWRTFEIAYDIPAISPEKVRVLLAWTDSNEGIGIATTSQARCTLQQEELSASRKWEKGGFFNLHYPELQNPDTKKDLDFSKKQNAIGFWSIPPEAFGPVPDVPYDTHKWRSTRVCDLTPFASQIQLGLFEIT